MLGEEAAGENGGSKDGMGLEGRRGELSRGGGCGRSTLLGELGPCKVTDGGLVGSESSGGGGELLVGEHWEVGAKGSVKGGRDPWRMDLTTKRRMGRIMGLNKFSRGMSLAKRSAKRRTYIPQSTPLGCCGGGESERATSIRRQSGGWNSRQLDEASSVR